MTQNFMVDDTKNDWVRRFNLLSVQMAMYMYAQIIEAINNTVMEVYMKNLSSKYGMILNHEEK